MGKKLSIVVEFDEFFDSDAVDMVVDLVKRDFLKAIEKQFKRIDDKCVVRVIRSS